VGRTDWLGSAELRVGLGCMRLSTDADRDEERALATVGAAVDAGISVFDTARAYGLDEGDAGHNERLLARALRRSGAAGRARIVTKGGMARDGGRWLPDGRASRLRADCEASLVALDGLPIDLYLVHAPDPRTPWRTTLRALARLAAEGLVRRVGVSNVTRGQLDEALELAPVAAVEVALSPFDDRALRGGVVDRCVERGLAVLAHAPLGGPARAPRLARSEALRTVAAAHDASPAEVALAWVLSLAPGLVAIPGARTPETARSAARAARLDLDARELEALGSAFGAHRPEAPRRRDADLDAGVVLVMGIPGAGKSRVAERLVEEGYVRLNRDERGGSLRDLDAALDDELAHGPGRVVLDNTYLGRAARSRVVETAGRHGVGVRCVWLDTPLAAAQVNLVERLLDRFGALPGPDELRAASRAEPGLLGPTSQMRALRELEPPSDDEGFAQVERAPFEQRPTPGRDAAGVLVAARAIGADGWEAAVADAAPEAPHLVFDWRPDGHVDELAEAVGRLERLVTGPVDAAVCPHGGGPPVCWCRPPLPGLPLAFARAHGVDPARSTVLGTSPAHRTLAAALGADVVRLPRPG